MERRYTAAQWSARLSSDGGTDPASVPRLFVSGDRSQVGKSSCCLGILATLVERLGYRASEIAYIKPATQCEATQLVARYCAARGIECVPIGPVVYVSGFTREFLAGNTKSSAEMAEDVRQAVDKLCARPGRRLVVVDGVGFPAVGSIVGLSNAELATAAKAPVVLVCPKGVGNAVDSFNLNRVFFEHYGVQVLGALFNRLPVDGYYSLDKCKESIDLYFEQYSPHHKVFGYLPELTEMVAASPAPGAEAAAAKAVGDSNTQDWGAQDERRLQSLLDAFAKHANVEQLVEQAIKSHRSGAFRLAEARQSVSRPVSKRKGAAELEAMPLAKRAVLSREEIRLRAMEGGAKSGG